MTGELALAELLALRLCHDLSGPLVALGGVTDLAEGSLSGEGLALARDATRELSARLRLLRAAWGPAATPLSVAELAVLASGIAGRRARIDLSALESTSGFTAVAARLVLNVAMLGAAALPAGGAVALSGSPRGDVTARLAGPHAAWPDGFSAMIADEKACRSAIGNPRKLQAPLTALMAHQAGIALSLQPAPAPGEPPVLRLALGS